MKTHHVLKCRQAVRKQRGQHTTQPIAMNVSLRPCTARLQAGVPTHPTEAARLRNTPQLYTHARHRTKPPEAQATHRKKAGPAALAHVASTHHGQMGYIYGAICSCYVPTPSWLRQGHDAGRLGACYWAANARASVTQVSKQHSRLSSK